MGAKQSFPDAENQASVEFLLGRNRPESDIPRILGNVLVAAERSFVSVVLTSPHVSLPIFRRILHSLSLIHI